MKSLSVKGFDLVIISTTYCGKYVKIDPQSRVVAYCYTPFRLAWNPNSYPIYTNSKGILRYIFNTVISILRKIDQQESQKINHFIAMTRETQQRLIESYKPESYIPIINPSVELDNYELSKNIGDYYLIVSRLEPYKKVDLAIKAFNNSKRKLVVVGRGSMKGYLKSIANDNIVFHEMLSNSELAQLYKNCKGFVFPQYEDYGLTPIEANAAGRPVIAFGKGGVLDTMIPYHKNQNKATAYFFYEQSVESLNEAITNFERLTFAPDVLRKNAERFSQERFKNELEAFIGQIMK
ncbi:glycosyltransferase [Ekhidna sp.]|uniref:glycosyltransferase n=1 Tax=Ekhidna sp. TaxID=2608089 RepID=UPI003B50BDC4